MLYNNNIDYNFLYELVAELVNQCCQFIKAEEAPKRGFFLREKEKGVVFFVKSAKKHAKRND